MFTEQQYLELLNEFKTLKGEVSILKTEIETLKKFSICPITSEEIINLSKYNSLTEEQLKHYLNCGGDINYHDVWTALMWASYKGHENVVNLLIKYGANLDIKDNLGNTALMMADANGHLNIVNLLIDAGAVSTTNDGQTVFEQIKYYNYNINENTLRYFEDQLDYSTTNLKLLKMK